MCQHKTCAQIKQNGGKTGVACMILNEYKKNAIVQDTYAYFGKERGGIYQHTYNLCAGKLESCDNGCYIAAIIRELLEEFKIDARGTNRFGEKRFDKIFRSYSGEQSYLRYFMFYNTPIFIGYKSGISCEPIRKQMLNDNLCHPYKSYREMDDFQAVKIGTNVTPEGQHITLSKFATRVMEVMINNPQLYK